MEKAPDWFPDQVIELHQLNNPRNPPTNCFGDLWFRPKTTISSITVNPRHFPIFGAETSHTATQPGRRLLECPVKPMGIAGFGPGTKEHKEDPQVSLTSYT